MALKFIQENGEDKGRADPAAASAKNESKKKWHGSWHSWSTWDADKWVPRSEHEELQNRLKTAEGTIAGLQWRMSCWESWHYYQGQPSYGYVYQSAEARPAREPRAESNRTLLPEETHTKESHAKKRKKKRKDRQRWSEDTGHGDQHDQRHWQRKK